MKSGRRGRGTSGVEVTNLSPHGFWLLLDNREVFLPFADFPWFHDATVRAITRVERPSRHHLYWPDLDIDLAVDSLDDPEKYPLVSRARPNELLRRTRARRKATTRKPPRARRG